MEFDVSGPKLTIVIVFYDMAREAARSLFALSDRYQTGVTSEDYEVIAVDNGSPEPLPKEFVESFGPNFRLLSIAPAKAHSSPCSAINHAVDAARSPAVGIMIDGARIASPGVLALALQGLSSFERAVITTIGLHLGPAMQTRASETGYNQEVEDELLASLDWQSNGYRLFEASVLTGVNRFAWFGHMAESNLFFMERPLFDEVGGFDVRFDRPGGGFANLDFYNKASQLEQSALLTLFGEATFHQVHGGVMSSRSHKEVTDEVALYRQQYRDIRGIDYAIPKCVPILFGQIRQEASDCMRAGLAALDERAANGQSVSGGNRQ